MQVETVPIESVQPDPANVRTHPTRNIDAIRGSLAKFGQQRPILVGENGVIIAGNGTWEAAKALGWKEIAVVRSPLKGVDAVGYALADNRTGETSLWDYEGVSKLLKQLQAEEFDLSCLGWQDYELEPLLKAEWTPPEVDPGADPNLGLKKEEGEESTPSEARDEAAAKAGWIEVTKLEREAFERAAKVVVDEEGLNDASEGEVLRRICERFLEKED